MVTTVKDTTASWEPPNATTDPLETKPISVFSAPTSEDTLNNANDHAANLHQTRCLPGPIIVAVSVPAPSLHPNPRNSKTTTRQPLAGSAPEILLEIIKHLDAPSVVCLALTSRTTYTLILQNFRVSRLCKLCPKDVRAPIPRALRPHAYNILAPDTEVASKGWRVENLTLPPSSTLELGTDKPRRNRNLLLMIERMAYIRRVAWHPIMFRPSTRTPPSGERPVHVQTPPSGERSVHVQTPPSSERPVHVQTPPSGERSVHVQTPPSSERSVHVQTPPSSQASILVSPAPQSAQPPRSYSGLNIPCPVPECRAYLDWCALQGREEGRGVIVEMRVFGLKATWARREVESVEYLVLRALLSRAHAGLGGRPI
ncbi:hypothetical protein CLCR_07332 [Cladophialophora carrionii]|uniref:F-box domain-containing protein n=1 Tax=Cladophialophora carrionii TaxID=86049 RepID=A0A1C1CNI8_9EURO|nr:hypothetical protein CLCR_07332 [Cladophialophora carrionii]